MKTIYLTRKTTPDSIIPYGDNVRVVEDGEIIYDGACSTNPNPFKPGLNFSWKNSYAQVAAGTYSWEFVKGHPKFGDCIMFQSGGQMKTTNANVNHGGAYYAMEIFMHHGDKSYWRGSAACFTIPPDKASVFFGRFELGDRGTMMLYDQSAKDITGLPTILSILLLVGTAMVLGKRSLSWEHPPTLLFHNIPTA